MKKLLYLRLFRPFFHILIISFSFILIYQFRKYTDFIPFVNIPVPYLNFNDMLIFLFLSIMLYLIISFFVGIYKLVGPIHGYYNKFFKIFFLWFVFSSFIAYFGKDLIFESGVSRFVLVIGSLVSFIGIIIFDIFYNFLNLKFEKQKPYRVLALYTEENLKKQIKDIFKDYNLYMLEFLEFEKNNDKLDMLDIKKLSQYDLVFIIGDFHQDFLQALSDKLRLLDKKMYYIPNSFFLKDLIYKPVRLGPMLVFEHYHSPLDDWWKVVKRVFDIIFSLLFILFFWWLYILIAFYIYVKDGRPIIYKSLRVGKGGRLFKMYKFRTMIKDADKLKNKLKYKNEREGPLFKLENDPRIPTWGKFLRKTSLDEIPQFFNVLKGEMSVVGPRPHLPEEVKNYKGWQKRLLSIKPGITGYAQVFGRDKLSFDEEAQLDLYYIQNWSIFLDLYVILATLKVIFKGN